MDICDDTVEPEVAEDLDWIRHLGFAYRVAFSHISKKDQKLVASNDFWGLQACGMIAVTRSSFIRQWMRGYLAASPIFVPPLVPGSTRCA